MNLIKLLGKYKASDESKKTHTIIPNLKSKEYKFGATYSIPDNLVKDSCDLFYRYLFETKGTLSITEAFPDVCPLYIDLDIAFDGSQSVRQYTDNTIDTLVHFLHDHIRENIEYEGDLVCYVQEKSKPKLNESGGVIKEGLHLLYPQLIGDFKVFNELFKFFLIKLMNFSVPGIGGIICGSGVLYSLVDD